MIHSISLLDRCLDSPDNSSYWAMTAKQHRKYIPGGHTLPWQKLKTPWTRLALWLCFFDPKGIDNLVSLLGSQHFGVKGNAILEAILATTPVGSVATYKDVCAYLQKHHADKMLAYEVVTLLDNRDSFAVTLSSAGAQVAKEIEAVIRKK